MKIKKKQYIIAGSVTVAVLLIAILCVVLLPNRTPQTPYEIEPNTDSTVSVSDISVEDPEKTDDTTSDTNEDVTDGKIPDGATVLTPDEKMEEGKTNQTGEKTDTAAQPVTTNPLPDESGNGGIVIGGSEQPKPYSCGVKGHHCEASETHAYILNLELDGCEYCGSHNCPSFYGTDEWGNAGLFPKLCPKYDIHKDPVYYCQTCGKKCGDGSGGTCVQFVNSAGCPNCGEWVEGWKCHTCK